MSPVLYIVATPIGNLEDITFRAVRILKEVDLIAAEDTRHTLKLLSHFGISKPLTSYFDHNQRFKAERIISELNSGKSVALVSDAGTPSVSDPGYKLVCSAIEQGIKVVPIPGVSAAIAALSASGLPSDQFSFIGFPPPRHSKRLSFFSKYLNHPGTLIIYEAPHRLLDSLHDLQLIMPERRLVIARELTKIYEEFVSGTADDLISHYAVKQIKGEVVILVSPGEAEQVCSLNIEDELVKLFNAGISLKDASRQIAEISGKNKSEVYSIALSLRK